MIQDDLGSNYQKIQREIQKYSTLVTFIAVGKRQSFNKLDTLYRLGHRDFGENYVQEAIQKWKQMQLLGNSEMRIHFIGHLQRNKVKKILPILSSLHTVDTLELAQEIHNQWLKLKNRLSSQLPVFLEVNISEEKNKFGFSPAEVIAKAREISFFPSLELLGLMCIPKLYENFLNTKSDFKYLRELELQCRPYTQGRLSMGMSSDYLLALGEGATDIRIGTKLFGYREF